VTQNAQLSSVTLINLDRTPDRLSEFVAHNQSAVNIRRFSAIDGKSVDRTWLVQEGILAPDNRYSDGAVGCVLSHLALWRQVIADDRIMTICEDDAILNHNFSSLSDTLMSFCEDKFDLIFWGWNFDGPLLYDVFPGGVKCAARFDHTELLGFVDIFKSARLYPSLHRLYETYGTLCYSISPQGARKLIARLFPLGAGSLFSASLNRYVQNIGFDNVMNGFHGELASLVAIPPLAISMHDILRSTVANPAVR